MFYLRRAIFALAIAMAVPVCAAQAATFTVDRNDDADVSACSTAANDCTLRGAINKANSTAGADTINFADSVRGAIQLSVTSSLSVTSDITINGPGADQLTLSGNGLVSGGTRILSNAASGQLTVKGLQFTRGAPGYEGQGGTSYGGAIENRGTLALAQCVFNRNNHYYSGGAINNIGTLSINQSTFTENSCYNNGGAILNSGTLMMSNSTVANNRSVITSGGGIYNSGTATVVNSTLSGNSADGSFSGSSTSTSASGGGIYNTGDFVLCNCTLSDNKIASRDRGVFCGGAICSESGSLVLDSCTITNNFASKGGGVLLGGNVTIGNTIISGNSQSDVDAGATLVLTDKGYNLLGTGTAISRFTGSGNQIGADPKFGTFFNRGGFTSTYELLPGSPAIDAGKTALTTDQRGIARPQGSAADIGAYESEVAAPPTTETPSLIVTTLDDVVANDGQTSLREAIDYANAKAGADTITFADNVRGASKLNGSALPTISSEIIINGPGAPNLTVDGDRKSSLVLVGTGGQLQLNDLTMSGGVGGAIGNEGYLETHQLVVSGNGNASANGGGIFNKIGTVALYNSTISDNSALSGGGVYNDNGSISVVNSTLSGNSAASDGGAIYSFGGTASTNLESSTISGNSTPNSAGVRLEGGVVQLHNSILSGNGTLDLSKYGGTVTNKGYNLIGTLDDRSILVASDRVGVDAKLGALSDNGGPTPTRALLTGSPAINSGDPAIQSGFDQRSGGFPRVRGGIVDVGAFELQSDAVVPTVTLAPQNPATNRTLTAMPQKFDSNAVYTYLWKRNGIVIAGETANQLDLSKTGNGEKGDVIVVEVSAAGKSATSSVTVINSAPFAFSRNVIAPADIEVTFELQGADPDGDELTFKLLNQPVNGSAEIRFDPRAGKNKLFYRSRAPYSGVEVLRFVAVDTAGATSAEATLGIQVRYTSPQFNRAPVAGDTFIGTFVGESVVKGLLGSDADGDAITFRIVNNARYGKSEIRRDSDGQFKLFYTSLNRFYGNDRVTYIVTDSRGKESNLATVDIKFVNRAPVAQSNRIGVASGALVSQYLFGTDEDGDALTFRLVNNPRYGQGEVERDEDGKWRFYYQSLPGYAGPDRITFIAIDSMGRQSQVATIDINVVRVSSSAVSSIHTAPNLSGGAS